MTLHDIRSHDAPSDIAVPAGAGRIRRVAAATISSIAILCSLALAAVAYMLGWIGLAMATMLPLAACVAVGAVALAACRRRVLWRGWRDWAPTTKRRLVVHGILRTASWMLIGWAAYLSLPRSMMSVRDASSATWAIVGSVMVLALATLVPYKRRYVTVTVMVTALAAFCGWQMVRLAAPPEAAATIAAPVVGRWVVQTGGNSVLVNHHYPLPQQRYALDLAVPYSRGGVDRSNVTDYPAYGKAVTAPADGEVVRAEAGRRDQPLGVMDPDRPLGNFVVIRLMSDRYVLLAHLKEGSVRVQPGERVRQGQPLAEVGNSGNSSEPHLHLQVQTGPDLLNETATGWQDIETVPFAFEGAGGDVGGTDVPRMDDRLILASEDR